MPRFLFREGRCGEVAIGGALLMVLPPTVWRSRSPLGNMSQHLTHYLASLGRYEKWKIGQALEAEKRAMVASAVVGLLIWTGPDKSSPDSGGEIAA